MASSVQSHPHSIDRQMALTATDKVQGHMVMSQKQAEELIGQASQRRETEKGQTEKGA